MTWTRLTGITIAKRLTVRLRFGEPADIHRPSGGDGVLHYWFTPGQVFGVVWWARLSPRKQVAGFAVVEALAGGEAGYRLPAVTPAVHVHAFLNARPVGQDRRVVDDAEALIHRIEHDGIKPARVPSAYYRAAGQSLRVRREPRRLDHESLRRFERSDFHAN